MRKLFIILFLSGILLLGSTAIADVFQILKDGNIRSGPGTNFLIVGKTITNQTWDVIKEHGEWIKIGNHQFINKILGEYINPPKEEILIKPPPEIIIPPEIIEPVPQAVSDLVVYREKLNPINPILMGVIFILLFIILYLGSKYIKFNSTIKEYKSSLSKYDKITNLDLEEEIAQKEITELKQRYEEYHNNLNQEYDKQKVILESQLDEASEEIQMIYEGLKIINAGFRDPYFEFDTPSHHKVSIEAIRNLQQDLHIKNEACICTTIWSIGNSQEKGKEMAKQLIDICIRTFNGICDSANSFIQHDNHELIEQKLIDSFVYLNKRNKSNFIYLTEDFLKLKLDELNLSYKYQVKKYKNNNERK